MYFADLSRNLTDSLSPFAHLFCTRNRRTNGVHELAPFVLLTRHAVVRIVHHDQRIIG